MNVQCKKDNAELTDQIALVLSTSLAVCVFHKGMLQELHSFSRNFSSTQVGLAKRLVAAVSQAFVIPQAVQVLHASGGHDDGQDLLCDAQLPSTSSVVLLPAGIRAVKDVTFCMESFATHNRSHPEDRLCLVVVGPVLCGQEHERVQSVLLRLAQVDTSDCCIRVLPPVPRATLLRWMSECVCVLNSSISEGMPNAVMEAMALGVPVVVRNNSGNTSLVTHGETGTVFDSAADALAACLEAKAAFACTSSSASAASDHPVLAMASRAQEHMQQAHGEDAERSAWSTLLQSALSTSSTASG